MDMDMEAVIPVRLSARGGAERGREVRRWRRVEKVVKYCLRRLPSIFPAS